MGLMGLHQQIMRRVIFLVLVVLFSFNHFVNLNLFEELLSLQLKVVKKTGIFFSSVFQTRHKVNEMRTWCKIKSF